MKHFTHHLLSILLIGGCFMPFLTGCEKDLPNGEGNQNNQEKPDDGYQPIVPNKPDPDNPDPENPDPENPDPEKPEKPERAAFMDLLGDPLSNKYIYSKAVTMPQNAVIQSFDIDKYGGIYYLQVAGNSQHQLNLVRATRTDTKPQEKMVLEYFGHGTNMAIEERPEGTYIWVASYGTKASNKTYGGSQVISRFKYKGGSTIQSGYGEHFYLPGERNIHPAINQKQDLLGVTYTRNGKQRFIAAYRLSDVMNLPAQEMMLNDPIKYGGEDNRPEKKETPVIRARDLRKVKPLYCVEIGYNADGIPFQGFDVEEDKCYYFDGAGNINDSSKDSQAYVIVVDKNGNKIERKEVKAASNRDLLKQFGMADRGYFEAEGIKVKNNTLYLGAATRKWSGLGNQFLANILIYK